MLGLGGRKATGQTDSTSATTSSGGGDVDGAASTGRGLVFPPINITETGIDIDMDNLFRRWGALSRALG